MGDVIDVEFPAQRDPAVTEKMIEIAQSYARTVATQRGYSLDDVAKIVQIYSEACGQAAALNQEFRMTVNPDDGLEACVKSANRQMSEHLATSFSWAFLQAIVKVCYPPEE